MKSYSLGDTPEELIKSAAQKQCPDGYPMTIKDPEEWTVIAEAVNQGIDSHLEALTERSSFDASTGKCLVHPAELHVLLRRLYEQGDDTTRWAQDEMPLGWDLRSGILFTLGIEEI